MNQGKYIFAQFTDFLSRRQFDNIVARYSGNKYVKSFTCWNQMLYMIFGQLMACDSMRDLMLALETHQSKCYHLGFGSTVTRTNLEKANRNRNCKIFEEFVYLLIETARKRYYRMILRQRLKVMCMLLILLPLTYVSVFGGLNSETIKEVSNCILYMM